MFEERTWRKKRVARHTELIADLPGRETAGLETEDGLLAAR